MRTYTQLTRNKVPRLIMSEKKLNNMDVTTDTDRVSWDKEKVIEQVWKDFHGMVTRSTIEQLISEVIQI